MEIVGTYNKTIFRDEKSGYTKFYFITKSLDEYKNRLGLLPCSGVISIYATGIPLKLTGEIIKKNNNYVFNVTSAIEYSDNKELTISFLSNKFVEGIGEKTAEKIVEVTGADIFSFINNPDAEKILIKAGISEKKVNEIIITLKNSICQKEIFNYIKPFGGEYSHAVELFNLYGYNYEKRLKENCYKYGEAAGLSFYTCDAIAKSLNKGPFDEDRIVLLLKTILQVSASSGNTYATLNDIINLSDFVVKSSAFIEKIPVCLFVRAALRSSDIIIENDTIQRFYFKPLWFAEHKTVQNINRIRDNASGLPFYDSLISECEKICGMQYSDKQKEAFNFLKSSGIKILTGGPGTGKTTVINGIITAYKILHPEKKISLCAPTGRAAQKMSESTGMEASTIHRLLEINAYDDSLASRDFSLSSDFVIVDEASMVDAEIFSLLVSALKDDVILLLCGDIDQLPSVGAGNILKDLIDCNLFEVNKLDVIYRQSNGSNIVKNAIAVNTGNTELITDKNFKIINVNNDDEIPDIVSKIVTEKYDESNPYDLQILTSTKKDMAGTKYLNLILQEICNSSCTNIGYGNSKFKVGDKIITTANNYDIGYINGDIGIIKETNSSQIVVEMNGEEIIIPNRHYKDVSLAYSMTIHKSQGSEYATVIVVLPENPTIMLKRNLLYTAITRAKKEVFIIAKKETLEKSILTVDENARQTMLKEKLLGYIPNLIVKKKF